MAYAKLSTAKIALLKSLRSLAEDMDDPTPINTMRAAVFADAKAQFGIPAEHKLKVEIDDTTSPDYGVLIRKKTGERYPATPVAPAPQRHTYIHVDLDSDGDEVMLTDDERDADGWRPTDSPNTFDRDGELLIRR